MAIFDILSRYFDIKMSNLAIDFRCLFLSADFLYSYQYNILACYQFYRYSVDLLGCRRFQN